MRALFFAAATMAASGSAALASIPFHGSLEAFTAGPGARGPGTFGTGFEAGEGFALGPIEPQVGWTASGVNLPYASVSAANPASGSQHLRITGDTTVAAGTLRVILGPNLGVLPSGPSVTSADLNISAAGGAAYTLVGQSPSEGFLTWRVQFFANDAGSGAGVPVIGILDDPDLGGPAPLAFQLADAIPGGAVDGWTAGAYTNFRAEVTATNILYYYNNALIYTGQIFAGTRVEQIGALSDNRQLADVGDIDNYGVAIPSPASLALLALGGLALRRRR